MSKDKIIYLYSTEKMCLLNRIMTFKCKFYNISICCYLSISDVYKSINIYRNFQLVLFLEFTLLKFKIMIC